MRVAQDGSGPAPPHDEGACLRWARAGWGRARREFRRRAPGARRHRARPAPPRRRARGRHASPEVAVAPSPCALYCDREPRGRAFGLTTTNSEEARGPRAKPDRVTDLRTSDVRRPRIRCDRRPKWPRYARRSKSGGGGPSRWRCRRLAVNSALARTSQIWDMHASDRSPGFTPRRETRYGASQRTSVVRSARPATISRQAMRCRCQSPGRCLTSGPVRPSSGYGTRRASTELFTVRARPMRS